MNKPWILQNFLKELQYGFYIDVNPISDQESYTKILDLSYRWRGIIISKESITIDRSDLCKFFIIDLDSNPSGFVNSVYETHPGSMLHYIRIRKVTNVFNLFNSIYNQDVEIPYSTKTIYPHLNIICLEIETPLNDILLNQLYDQFDLKFVCKNDNYNVFVNSVMSFLI